MFFSFKDNGTLIEIFNPGDNDDDAHKTIAINLNVCERQHFKIELENIRGGYDFKISNLQIVRWVHTRRVDKRRNFFPSNLEILTMHCP